MKIPYASLREVVRMAREYSDNYAEELYPDAEPHEQDDLVDYARGCVCDVERWIDGQLDQWAKDNLGCEEDEA